MRRPDLLALLGAQPFRPFRMYVSDGAVFSVWHPELVMVTPTSAIVGVKQGEDAGPASAVERFSIVDLDHITRTEEVAPAPSA